MRARDELRRDVIRLMLSAVRYREIERGQTIEASEAVQVLQKLAKQHQESIEGFGKGGREDLIRRERAELAILEEYLPRQKTMEEIKELVDQVIKETGASGPSDMGKVMGTIMPRVQGQADGTIVRRVVQELLTSPPVA